MCFQQAEVASKRLELLRETFQISAHSAVCMTPPPAASAREADNVQTSARQLELAVVLSACGALRRYRTCFWRLKGQVGAIYLVENALIDRNRPHLIALALDAKVPIAGFSSEFTKAGALVSYGPNYADLFPRAARSLTKFYVGQNRATSRSSSQPNSICIINVKENCQCSRHYCSSITCLCSPTR